jgi:hypothetical protein
MLRELTLKWSFSYDDTDFKKVVEQMKEGAFNVNLPTSRTDTAL